MAHTPRTGGNSDPSNLTHSLRQIVGNTRDIAQNFNGGRETKHETVGAGLAPPGVNTTTIHPFAESGVELELTHAAKKNGRG
jgi:hypothetical protein